VLYKVPLYFVTVKRMYGYQSASTEISHSLPSSYLTYQSKYIVISTIKEGKIKDNKIHLMSIENARFP